jgi:tetratricopeptide (TPR) repeat protein
LNGSIRRAGDRLRITAQLIDAASDRQVWADRYDRELTDVFAVQDELTRAILAALAVELSPREQERVSSEPTGSIEAYEYYLRGRHAMNLLTRRALRLAYYSFEKAIELDPDFAEAYAALAMTYAVDVTGSNYAWNDWVRPPGRAMVQVPLLARKAALLKPGLVAPELALARLRLAEWRYDEAIGHARLALEREPGNAEAHATHALVLTAAGRHREALEAVEESLRRDPKPSASTLATLGIIRFALRDYDRAVEVLDRSFTAMIDGGSWFYGPFRLAAKAYTAHALEVDESESGESGKPSIAAVEFNHFYQQAADVSHLLDGLRIADAPQLPPEFYSLTTQADPVTGPALADLVVGRTLETLCWNPTLEGEMRFSAEGTMSWTVRHDVSETGLSRMRDDRVCVALPTITRNREACFSVSKVRSDEHCVRAYDYAFAGPSLCFFRRKQ